MLHPLLLPLALHRPTWQRVDCPNSYRTNLCQSRPIKAITSYSQRHQQWCTQEAGYWVLQPITGPSHIAKTCKSRYTLIRLSRLTSTTWTWSKRANSRSWDEGSWSKRSDGSWTWTSKLSKWTMIGASWINSSQRSEVRCCLLLQTSTLVTAMPKEQSIYSKKTKR